MKTIQAVILDTKFHALTVTNIYQAEFQYNTYILSYPKYNYTIISTPIYDLIQRSPDSRRIRGSLYIIGAAVLAHVERDPVVIAAADVEFGGQRAAADMDPAQFARQIDPAVVDVDRVVVGVPLDVERVEQASVVGVTEFVASEAVGPEVNVAVQRIAVLIESEVSGPYAARECVVEIVVVVFAGRKSDSGQKHACGE